MIGSLSVSYDVKIKFKIQEVNIVMRISGPFHIVTKNYYDVFLVKIYNKN